MRKLSPAMYAELEATAATERAGFMGRPAEFFQLKTLLALSRRGLIEPCEIGARRLTAAGWSVIGGR